MIRKCLFNLLLGATTLILLSPVDLYAVSRSEARFLYPEYSQKISMDFKGASLTDVLKIFSQQSGLNFIASEDIGGKQITLYLDNVPVETALERILHANDLTYEILPGSDIFVVKAVTKPEQELITRVYKLEYATVSASKLMGTISIETEDEEGGGSSSEEGEDAGGILEAVESVITGEGKVVEDPRTNSLIVSDIPTQFPIIEQTIAKLDVPIPQILIEVEMLDISKTTGDQLGIRFGTDVSFSGAQRTHIFPFDQQKMIQDGKFDDADRFTTGNLDFSGLTALLEFLKTKSDTKSLARPRILTLNNETAEIQISTDEAIGNASTTTGSDATARTTNQAERVETGVFLTVTPQANLLTGEIVMAIHPRVIEARTGGTFGGVTFRDPEERGSQSVLRVKDGQTIILGGLLRTETSKTVTKIPILGDLPLVGRAFRHRDRSETDRELLIFITPHILEEDYAPRTASQQFKKITREQDLPQRRERSIRDALLTYERQKL